MSRQKERAGLVKIKRKSAESIRKEAGVIEVQRPPIASENQEANSAPDFLKCMSSFLCEHA